MRRLCLLLSVSCLLSCSHRLTTRGFDAYVPDSDTTINWQGSSKPELQVLYLGAGHMIISSGKQAFFTDPFFSIQPTLKILGRMNSKGRYYQAWKSEIGNTSNLQAGLVSHSHYDHLMDLPLMLHEKTFPNLQAVYGNPYLPQMLVNFGGTGVALTALNASQVYIPGATTWNWVPVNHELKFLPIATNHAPQAFGHLFMSKELKPDYFHRRLTESYSKVGNFKWTVGESYAFLVDIGPEGNSVRVYIQTSASHSPNGLPPAAELQKKAVDLVILCYASTDNEENYPAYLLEAMKTPTGGYPQVLVVHWEDFFRSHFRKGQGYAKEPRLVALTRPGKVKKRWEALGLSPALVTMPRPGTVVTFR